MDSERLMHMEPDLKMLAEALMDQGTDCHIIGNADTRFRGVRLFTGTVDPTARLLYLLRPEDAPRFPIACACVCPIPLEGCPCLVCPGENVIDLLDRLNALFSRFVEWEHRLDELVYQNVPLTALCEAGAQMLDNPVCVHDDWFVMVARSRELPEVLQPDSIMSSEREFLPRIIVEDFMNDTDYLETFSQREPQVWDGTPDQPPSLYVNLWSGKVYRGRLLVVQFHRPFRRSDFMVAEVLAQRVMALLDRKQLGVDRPHRGMDDIVFDILSGNMPEAEEVTRLMNSLNWNPQDRVVCVRLNAQRDDDSAIQEHALHSELFQVFPHAYIMFNEREQCVLLNLTQSPINRAMLSHSLSPLCRDYCLYAGMSSPVDGLREWHAAWLEARYALDRAFARRDEKWIVAFSDCALDMALGSLQPPLLPRHLVAPELRVLMEYDAQKGTQYFDTLRVYLLEERDIPRASEKLIIHRTTLLYRLKKIEQLISLNLEDPWYRLNLMLSLRILESDRT